jgi:hypothetical protein
LIQDKELFNSEIAKVKSTSKNKYSNELVEAYVFAKDIGITTMSTVDTANLE